MRSLFALCAAVLAGCVAGSTAGGTSPGPAAVPSSRAPRLDGSVAGSAGSTAAPASGKIQRTLIDRRPATGLPGWETRLYLIEYAPGAAAPVHVHPAVGVGLVLEGRFESAFGDGPVVQVQAGEGFVDQADVTHRVFRNPSPDRVLRFVVAYTLRAGEEPFHLGRGTAPDAVSR